ncbi:hypothetical protein SAMN05660297_00978 [Natronincola peptidivorans]|uniref:Uncharacterized protein n=1 Tax=Natronincola peptidivorans TaxID=426128 RepID=A0A1I0ALB9_9FIRM|nr:hypothetical protein [Natronincola peptidivorans]SES95074.1 hypothetical protein SAMN05660297_00978 [Natronincola peptidivorans]
MFSSDQLDSLAKAVMNKLEIDKKAVRHNCEGENEKITLTPSQTLVILALLAGTLEVSSVVIDRNQNVDIVLAGTLKKEEESEMDKVLSQIGHVPFDEVMKALLKKFR